MRLNPLASIKKTNPLLVAMLFTGIAFMISQLASSYYINTYFEKQEARTINDTIPMINMSGPVKNSTMFGQVVVIEGRVDTRNAPQGYYLIDKHGDFVELIPTDRLNCLPDGKIELSQEEYENGEHLRWYKIAGAYNRKPQGIPGYLNYTGFSIAFYAVWTVGGCK
jgi:hypothetical protein